MAIKNGVNGYSHSENGSTISVDANDTLPGETFSVKKDVEKTSPSQISEPQFEEGPIINGRPTTLGLYEPHHLIDHPVMTPLRNMINEAYKKSENGGAAKILPGTQTRLPTEDAFFNSVGRDPGTFTYIVTYAGTNEVLGTGSAHHFVAEVLETIQKLTGPKRPREAHFVFTRFEPSPSHANAELWELKVLATDPALQKQGLATYLMNQVESETKRRYLAENKTVKQRKPLIMLLSSIKEINSQFYLKRGYAHDYETAHAKGVLGSETGFHVEHFSKMLRE